MTVVHLSGHLVCRSSNDVAIVVEHLARHVELTYAEVGCHPFRVTPTDDPMVWHVDELFRDAAAFRTHQAQVASSDWGRVTARIERRYEIEGL
ncbi:MAG: antibiotic biosynthesis monooxygenase [Actinobacteria bacterium 69-20]|nr:antibiotic biosynthesis monooxygenase [Actinomycetota bacterium]OJV23295.1 MAG: antibiotic biosynthesis monooxygenase [Actinobacteria bacterium 69-20]